MVREMGLAWTEPFLRAAERGLRGNSCATDSYDEEMKVWG
jgi:hypothetical protein